MAKREKTKAIKRKNDRLECKGKARLIGLPISARKVRVIAKLIKYKSVEGALASLAFQRKSAAKPLARLLDSAVANAVVGGLNVDKLFVRDVLVDKGAIRRRFMPRAQGKATRIRKQTSHIEMRLFEKFK